MNFRLSKQNQRGQMAIFVALIFQILFLFFAMAVNIGLVVHDKINLQNAVDLAAFYAAQRQAEQLNVIAHTNYQIRQSWKLLNWRYYVLGTMGTQGATPHPASGLMTYPRADDVIWPPVANTASLCVTYNPVWSNGRQNQAEQDNPCKTATFTIPNITVPRTVAPFLPFNFIFENMARNIQKRIAETCESYAGVNWFFGAAIYKAYAFDQQTRKELIYALARNLARKPQDMIDLRGQPIFAGAQKTFEKNLTWPNFQNPGGPPVIELFNSMEGLDPQHWLPSIDIWYTMLYQDMQSDANRCQSVTLPLIQRPTGRAWQELVQYAGNAQALEDLDTYVRSAASIAAGKTERLSLGVEKNPWYMAYVGVKAKTKPRQLFFPFGEPVQFEAKAFAQPFGGRIGPWHGRAWSPEALNSSGDPLQIGPEKLQANGMLNSSDPKNLMPQYSKYPGDRLGLKSVLAQSSLLTQAGIRTSLHDYSDITQEFGISKVNDILAFSPSETSVIRRYEIGAIAPDLFDITYYSIQPNFGDRYLRDLQGNRNAFRLPDHAYPRGDLGSRNGDKPFFSVKDQMAFVNAGPGVPGILAPDAFWYVRDRAHLLTSWVHNDTYGEYFAFPKERFGHCQEFDDEYRFKAPGSCVDRGGRAGYSVKIISPQILTSPLSLGGPGQSAGRIRNPPPTNW